MLVSLCISGFAGSKVGIEFFELLVGVGELLGGEGIVLLELVAPGAVLVDLRGELCKCCLGGLGVGAEFLEASICLSLLQCAGCELFFEPGELLFEPGELFLRLGVSGLAGSKVGIEFFELLGGGGVALPELIGRCAVLLNLCV